MRLDPFRVAIPEAEVSGLRERLLGARWPDAVEGGGWAYGIDPDWLRGMIDYWASEFDWRAEEAAINRFDQFRCELGGYRIHFLHVRGKGPNPKPLILTHGWPWTFWDWRALIGMLSDPAAHGGEASDAFDLVIPSLPGFGFSSPLTRGGLTFTGVADLWLQLMSGLGYERFGAVGGDMGAVVTGDLAIRAPERLTGIYLNTPVVPGVFALGAEQPFAPDEAWMAEQARAALPTVLSHFNTHRFDAQVLACALNDSPLGLAAWLWRRRYSWSDWSHKGSDPATVFGRDFLCANAAIYWFTGTIGSSMRTYVDNYAAAEPALAPPGRVIDTPTAYGVPPRELAFLPRLVAEQATDLRRWTVFPHGGHFSPAEIPDLIAPEVRAFFRGLN